jgi:hypothetical protein
VNLAASRHCHQIGLWKRPHLSGPSTHERLHRWTLAGRAGSDLFFSPSNEPRRISFPPFFSNIAEPATVTKRGPKVKKPKNSKLMHLIACLARVPNGCRFSEASQIAIPTRNSCCSVTKIFRESPSVTPTTRPYVTGSWPSTALANNRARNALRANPGPASGRLVVT